MLTRMFSICWPRDPPASPPKVLGLLARATTPGQFTHFSYKLVKNKCYVSKKKMKLYIVKITNAASLNATSIDTVHGTRKALNHYSKLNFRLLVNILLYAFRDLVMFTFPLFQREGRIRGRKTAEREGHRDRGQIWSSREVVKPVHSGGRQFPEHKRLWH